MNRIANYFKDIEPSDNTFLKEILRRITDSQYDDIFKNTLLVPDLDPYILRDAFEFFRLAIINLMGYKHLVNGNFLAWAHVTSYYSLFYSMNFFLRLKGFAISNVERFKPRLVTETLTLKLERDWSQHAYRFEKSGVNHNTFWRRFNQLYPNLVSRGLGKAVTSERASWNYDLFYPSHATEEFTIESLDNRKKYNFLDPNFVSKYSSPEAQEYWHEFMISYGIEEAGPCDFIDIGLEYIVEIANRSSYSDWYKSKLKSYKKDIDFFESSKDMRTELHTRIDDALSNIP